MERVHAELLARLEGYSFRPSFVPRLMRENGWSRAYAERVCREYMRFLFLARVAGHPCTPSDQVDQVWHLHLLHTEDYWLELCPAVLRNALHHGPSGGGTQEATKFRDWYTRTVESYRHWFGVEPAAEIWPVPAQRFATDFRRVDRRRFWLLPKPHLAAPAALARHTPGVRKALLLTLLSLLIASCAAIRATPPWHLPGPEFLTLLLSVWALCVMGALYQRWRVRTRLVSPVPPELEAYELAYLAGGEERVASALLARLLHGEHLALLDEGRCVVRGARAPSLAHPLEWKVWQLCSQDREGGRTRSELRTLIREECVAIARRLGEAGYLLRRDDLCRQWALALAPLPIGMVKFGLGIAADKPVTLLALALVVLLLASLYLLPPGRVLTRAGEALLAEQRAQLPATSELDPAKANTAQRVPIEWMVALVGLGTLNHEGLSDLTAFLSRSEREEKPASPGCGGDGGGGGCGGGCGGCGCGGCGG